MNSVLNFVVHFVFQLLHHLIDTLFLGSTHVLIDDLVHYLFWEFKLLVYLPSIPQECHPQPFQTKSFLCKVIPQTYFSLTAAKEELFCLSVPTLNYFGCSFLLCKTTLKYDATSSISFQTLILSLPHFVKTTYNLLRCSSSMLIQLFLTLLLNNK